MVNITKFRRIYDMKHVPLIQLLRRMKMKQLNNHLRQPQGIINQQPLLTTAYLINTSKVVKGSKLKTQDYIKLQLLKYRHCSPNQLNALPQPPFVFVDKTRIFEEVNDEDELRRKIKIRREKESRQTRKRMKLFNNARSCEGITDDTDNLFKCDLSVGPKPTTSYSSKRTSSSKNYSYNQTISYDFTNLPQKKIERNLQFRSDNLGKKKNEYLNSLGMTEQRSQTANNTPAEPKGDNDNQRAISHKRKPNTYMRQWKKYFKVKMEVQKEEDFLTPFNSQELSESLEKQVNKDIGLKISNWKQQSPSFYSMQLRTAQIQGSAPHPFLQKQGNNRLNSKWTTPVLTKR